jgi:hypothetical protein
MPRATRDTKDDTALKDARVAHAIHTAVIAAILFDPKGVEALLELPDAELGRRFKNMLWKVAGVATAYNLDLPALSEEKENLQRRFKRTSKLKVHEAVADRARANSERYPLLAEGKILRIDEFCRASRITEKRLHRDIAAGRVFSVDLARETYIPAFFLSNLFDRKDFAKVFHRLDGLPAWSKWDFLTTPIESQGGSTPLQLLMAESMEQVLKAADDFAKR